MTASSSSPKVHGLTVTRAMVMAAGFGKRMGALTQDKPKPLVPVLGRTLIDRVLDRLDAVGVIEAVVNIHYKGEMLRSHLEERQARGHGPAIRISDETDRILDTGGGVTRALPHLGDTPFFLHNSDSIWQEDADPNLDRLKEAWNGETMDALLLLVPLVNCSGFDGKGDFLMDRDGRLTRPGRGEWAPYAWIGVLLAHPRFFQDGPEGPFSTNLFFDRAIASGRLHGLQLDGFWMHVGTPEGLGEAEDILSRHDGPPKTRS